MRRERRRAMSTRAGRQVATSAGTIVFLIGLAGCGPEILPQRDRDAARAWAFLMGQQANRAAVLTEIAGHLAAAEGGVFRTRDGAITARALAETVREGAALHADLLSCAVDCSRDAAALGRYQAREQRYRSEIAARMKALARAAAMAPGLDVALARLKAAAERVARAEKRFGTAVAAFNAARARRWGRFWASVMFFELTPRPEFDS